MAVALRSSSVSGSADVNSLTCTVPKPAGALTDDIVVVGIEYWSATSAAITVNSASVGFTEIATIGPIAGSTGFIWLKVFRKRLLAGEASSWAFVATGGSGVWNLGHAVAISGGVLSGTPEDGTPNTASSASSTAEPTTTVTTTTLAFLAHFLSRSSDASQTTVPTGFTQAQGGNVLTTNTRIAPATGSQSASGGVISNAQIQLAVLVAIKPEPASGVTGILGITLGAATLTMAGTAEAAGTLGLSPGAPTLALAGTADASGTLGIAPGAPTLSVSGTADSAASLALSLGSPTLDVSGTASADGTLGLAPGSVSLSMTGVMDGTGTLAITLSPVGLDMSGSAASIGALDLALSGPQLAMAAGTGVDGALQLTLGGVVFSASATASADGTINLSPGHPGLDLGATASAEAVLGLVPDHPVLALSAANPLAVGWLPGVGPEDPRPEILIGIPQTAPTLLVGSPIPD